MVERIYNTVFPRLPRIVRRPLSVLDYYFAGSPGIYRDSSAAGIGLERGAVVVSLDFEMAWAWQYARNQSEGCVAKGLREREQVPKILEAFERFHFPATWATVGHLFLEACVRGSHGLAHEHMPRVEPFQTARWAFVSGDWYQFDPCTDVARDPAWYAPDLIERILSSRVNHEIACHGFSHVGFGRYCSPEVAAAEIDACSDAMAKFGLAPRGFVFPGNDEGNFAVLAQKGIQVVRSFPVPRARVSLPVQRTDGLWGVHTSSGIDRGKEWSLGQRVERLKNFVRTAMRTKLSAHVWLHPSLPRRDFEEVLIPFLSFCADEREKGFLDIVTMKELVARTASLYK